MALGIALAAAIAACTDRQKSALELAEKADALLQQGNLTEARITIQAAIRERDDIAAIYIEKGRIEMASKSLVEAFRAYSEALALDATNVEALQAVSQLGYIVGARDEAMAAASRLLLIQPGEPNALLIKGLAALQVRNYTDAAKFSDDILRANPTDVRGLILKARIHFSQGDTGKALAVLAPVAGERSVPVTQTLLELHRNQGDAAAMLDNFALLSQLRPDNVRQIIDEANVRYKTGDTPGARSRITRLVERPDLTSEDILRLVTLWQQYDPDPFPGRPPRFRSDLARQGLARHYIDAGQPARALAFLGKAASPADRGLLARAANMLGQPGPAVLDEDRTQCDGLLARAWSNRTHERARTAIVDAQQAISECPREAGGYWELIRDYQALGDRAGEMRAFDQALEALPLNPTVAQSYFDRAVATGDLTRAASVARRVTRQAPSLTLGWKLLDDACRRIADPACVDEAAAGLSRAARAYGLDPLPGEPAARELFGRLDQ